MTDYFDFSDSSTEIAWQKSYWLNEQRIADSFGVELSARLQDLLTLATSVYVADRKCTRPLATLGLWQRQLRLRVPLQDAAFWKRSDVHEALLRYLRWLTEDDWEFDLVPRAQGRPPGQSHMFSAPPIYPTKVALFSGGLDSLAGAATDLDSDWLRELIVVAASSNTALRRVQFDLVRGLRGLGAVRHVNVPLNLIHRVAAGKDERTQRSRGFLYAAVGSAVAELAGVRGVTTYENGVGALNLPYVESQIGAQSSRSVHPRSLRLASRLLSLVHEHGFIFEAPNAGLTKAELCARLPAKARTLVRASVSCDGFPSRIAGRLPCGACTSCLLRRQALHVSGLARLEPAGSYRADDPDDDATHLAERNLHDMLSQAAAIQTLSAAPNAWSSMTARFPSLAAADDVDQPPLLREAARRGLLDMLRRYAEEWRSYPSAITHLYFPNIHARRAASG